MKYKILKEINISGKTKGDTIEAEPHAMVTYLKNEEVIEVKKRNVRKK